MSASDFCIDLEISLDRVNDAYRATTRLRQLGGGRETDPLYGRPANVYLDVPSLVASWIDTETYSRQLTNQLFADQRLYTAYVSARNQAHSHGLPLRLRLRFAADDILAHTLRWELLRDPELDVDIQLAGSEHVRLIRHIAVADTTPYIPPPRSQLRALIAVANPRDLTHYGLAAIDPEREIDTVAAALGEVSLTCLGRDAARATLRDLGKALREQPDIFYLICHGSINENEQVLWLEAEDGRAQRINATFLKQVFAGLPRPPALVVLAACQGGGSDRGSLVDLAIGPMLVRAGVPAVVAMHGTVSVETVDLFVLALFRELRRDGRLDRAVSVARAAVFPNDDWWRPVLFTALQDCRVWQSLPEPGTRRPIAPPLWPLSPQRRRRVIDALLSALAMQPLIAWERLIRLLPSVIQLQIDSASEPVITAEQILDACLSHQWGLEALGDAIYYLLRDNIAFTPIAQAIDNCSPRAVPLEALAPLKESIDGAGLGDTLLRRLFYNSAPDTDLPAPDAERSMALRCIDQLARLPRPTLGTHPLWLFVQAVRAHLDPSSTTVLTAWLERHQELSGAEEAEAQTSSNTPPTLFIELRIANDESYYLRAWLWGRHLELIFAEDSPYSLAAIRDELLIPIYDRCAAMLGVDEKHLSVEFFLPTALLAEAVDHWDYAFGDTLGFRYKVVVRLQERAVTPRAWPRWQSHWEQLGNRSRPLDPMLVHCIKDSEECTQKVLRIHLERAAALALGCVLPPPGLGRDTLFQRLLAAGTPIALWPRQALLPTADLSALIRELLTTDPLSAIPERIMRERQSAVDVKAPHLGHHLTLLWDDPDRLPHRLLPRLTAPR